MRKDVIRDKIKVQKNMLTAAEKQIAADLVFKKLEQSAAFILAEKILLYHSLPDELSTIDFIARWHTKKRFYLPRVNGLNLEILPYDECRLAFGAFHIEEPQGNDVIDISDIELIIVPGIAFDKRGNRVGRGKGYYDRLLPYVAAMKIGVGYDFQLIEETIDIDEFDIGVDAVITQSYSITIRK